jgi:hypothetical protein
MLHDLFDYVDASGKNRFAEWMKDQQKVQRVKLNARLDWLKEKGDALLPEILTNTHVRGILKLRIKGNVQLRPLLCRGPHGDGEYTLLMGAKEVGDCWQPKDAAETADVRKAAVAADKNRRCKHERIK